MSNSTSPVLICDGEFEIVQITEDLYAETIKLFKNHFMKYENVSIACNLAGTKESIEEMEKLIRAVLVDGISFAAIHCQTRELVAFAGNKILCPKTDCSLSAVCSEFRSPGMLCVSEYLERLECTFDIFKEWHLNCAMEIVFLSTNKNYNGRGLATILSKYSIEFARQMLQGTLKGRESLPAHIRDLKPEAVCSVFSSFFSQKVGQRLGFETLTKVPNSEFSFEGKTFAEKLDPIHTHSTFAAMRL